MKRTQVDIQVERPFDLHNERNSGMGFQIQRDPIVPETIEGIISEDYVNLDIVLSNGHKIKYTMGMGKKRERFWISVGRIKIDAIDTFYGVVGGTGSVVQDVLLTYQKMYHKKIKNL